MRKIIFIISTLFISLLSNSCGDFGDINRDPNKPEIADTRYLFNYSCRAVPLFAMVGTYDPWNQLYPQYFSERQNIQYSNYAMTDFNIGQFYYYYLKNLNAIIKLNTDEDTKIALHVTPFGSNENQIAVSRTLRAFIYMHLTDALGMIPYSEALQGEENFTPKYDTQEFIYTDLDKELNEAYAQFDNTSSIDESFDILFQGDIDKWMKFNASVRMMLAIKLSDVAPDVGKERFVRAFNDGAMIDNGDRLSYMFLPETANQSPLYENIIADNRKDFAPSKTILDQLIAYNDPRLEIYADPNADGEYVGVPYGISQAEIVNYKNTAVFDPKYYKQDAEQVVISPSHIILIEAEAAVRKWISVDAEELYKEGIRLGLDLHGINNDSIFNEYYDQRDIKFSDTDTDVDKISKIAMQRWLGNYMQDGIEAWSDWRRLNVPALKPGPAATVKHIPYRRYYYPDDYLPNKANYDEAIATQGPDNFDTRVWWDTSDN